MNKEKFTGDETKTTFIIEICQITMMYLRVYMYVYIHTINSIFFFISDN